MVLRRAAVGEPHHARQLPHRFHPRRDPRVRARRPAADEFADSYDKGLKFYEERLFEPDGEARFMSDHHYPIDIHGCAQGVITFALQQKALRATAATMSRRVLDWTLANMWDPKIGLVLLPAATAARRHDLPHQDPRAALVPGLDVVGAGVAPRVLRSGAVKGFPGRELSFDPGRSRFERTYAQAAGRTGERSAHPAAPGAARDRRRVPRHPRRRLRRRACSRSSWPSGTRRPRSSGSSWSRSSSPGPTRWRSAPGSRTSSFRQGDVTRLDFDAGFDLVVSVDNLEHVEDDVTAMHTPAARAAAGRPPGQPRPRLRTALVRARSPGQLRRARPRPPGLPGRGARRRS